MSAECPPSVRLHLSIIGRMCIECASSVHRRGINIQEQLPHQKMLDRFDFQGDKMTNEETVVLRKFGFVRRQKALKRNYDLLDGLGNYRSFQELKNHLHEYFVKQDAPSRRQSISSPRESLKEFPRESLREFSRESLRESSRESLREFPRQSNREIDQFKLIHHHHERILKHERLFNGSEDTLPSKDSSVTNEEGEEHRYEEEMNLESTSSTDEELTKINQGLPPRGHKFRESNKLQRNEQSLGPNDKHDGKVYGFIDTDFLSVETWTYRKILLMLGNEGQVEKLNRFFSSLQ